MATLVKIPEGGADRLVVVVRTAQPVPAGEAGRLLAAFDRAFRSWIWVRFRRRGIGLEITDTGSSSWWVVLTAAKDAYELLSAEPGLVGLFLADIDSSMKALTSTSPRDVPKYFRELLRSLGETGRRSAAEAVDLISIIRVSLDPEAFDVVTRPDVSEARPQPKKAKNEDLREYQLPAEVTERLDEHVRAGDLPARFYDIDDEWYARPAGMHKVMLPIRLPAYLDEPPVNRGDYIVTGTLVRSEEGYPIAINASALRRDRRATWDREWEEKLAKLIRTDNPDSPPRLPPPRKP